MRRFLQKKTPILRNHPRKMHQDTARHFPSKCNDFYTETLFYSLSSISSLFGYRKCFVPKREHSLTEKKGLVFSTRQLKKKGRENMVWLANNRWNMT